MNLSKKNLPVVWLQLHFSQRYKDGSKVIILKIWCRLILNTTIFVLGPIFSQIQAKNQFQVARMYNGGNTSGVGRESFVFLLKGTLQTFSKQKCLIVILFLTTSRLSGLLFFSIARRCMQSNNHDLRSFTRSRYFQRAQIYANNFSNKFHPR